MVVLLIDTYHCFKNVMQSFYSKSKGTECFLMLLMMGVGTVVSPFAYFLLVFSPFCTLCSSYCQLMRLTVVNVGGLDIIDGNRKLILAIMWQLMRRHTLNLLQVCLSASAFYVLLSASPGWSTKLLRLVRYKDGVDGHLLSLL